MKIILLPGLDGTGFLFEPFLESASNEHDVSVLPLIQDRILSSSDQAQHIAKQIGTEPCTLIAESYSGLIAYELVQKYVTGIRHIIFVAAFLTKPSAISGAGRYFPMSLVKIKLIPTNIVGIALFGRWRTKTLTDLFLRAVRGVEGRVVKSRIKELSALTDPTEMVSIPCTYIQASKDLFVEKEALRIFDRLCQHLDVHVVEGTHFLLQTSPEACWKIINEVSVEQII